MALAYELLTLIVPLGLVYYLLRFPVIPAELLATVVSPQLFDVPSGGSLWGSNQNLIDWSFGTLIFLACVETVRRYYNDLYLFGNRRIIHFKGRASIKFRRITISYSDVVEIRIHQNIWGRLFNFGTLAFGTASSDLLEVQFRDIPNPQRLALQVEEVTNPLAVGTASA